MGFLDFFRKTKSSSEPVEIIEKINFSEATTWVGNKKQEINEKEREIFILVDNKIEIFIKDANEKIKILESVNMDSKNVEERVKSIVKENLNNYVIYVRRFIDILNNLKKEKLEEFTSKINKGFSDFKKRSRVSYQKATFLWGDEMFNLDKVMVDFFNDLTKLFNENKEIVDSSKKIELIELDLDRFMGVEKNISEVNERSSFLYKKIKNIGESEKRILNEIEDIKKSEDYIKNLKVSEKIGELERELEENTYKLKEMIDFKSLGNILHGDKKKMDLVKLYRENFLESLQKSNGEDILSLLSEVKLSNDEIFNNIKKIKNYKNEIMKNTKMLEKDRVESLLAVINDMKSEAADLDNEKIREEKKCDKFKETRKNIRDSIKLTFHDLNVVFDES
jgi:hypothetical protein